jgi:hypothetical protein
MRRSLKTVLLSALASLFMVASAQAVPIAIVFGIDASGSISPADYALQRDAYVSVLSSLLPADGTVAVGVYEFGRNVSQVYALQTIGDAADKASLLATMSGMNRSGINTGWTNIGDTIDAAKNDILAFGLGNITEKALIDISTDGAWNFGANPSVAAANAVAAGIDQVNCLGVGSGADCTFIAGVDAFAIAANSFADFERALTTKLEREIGPVIPEPSSVALYGVSLLLVSMAVRRRRS